MWEVLKRAPRGRISLRNLSLLATGLLVAVLLNIGFTNIAHAEDVIRTTDGFSFQNKSFTTQIQIQPGDPRNLATAATGAMTAYEYKDSANTRAEYIYFANGVDPATATTAMYVTFDFSPPSTYTNRSPIQDVTISSNPAVLSSENTGGGSCKIPGLGWFLCPVGSLISAALDGMYGLMMTFLDVKPILSGSPLYDIWNAIRSIANVVFVIVFLIIIFSQVTSVGISTYGIRSMLPRLIIAAILVNVSFFIAALGVDLSNFLGHAVYVFITSMAKSLDSATINISWEDLTTNILAGGGAVGGVAAAHLWFASATAGSLAAAWFTILGMLISAALAILTALVVLFVRQALIIILIIIAPLAFVAMVLPSTEKWYKKWQETFMAMLLMFPIFSLVFSGAMLAGAAIIVSANGNIFLIILGKGVQILPLFVAPLVVKLSTGLLGTIAKITNDRNKGIVDRAKNWTGAQAEHHRKKSLASKPLLGNKLGKLGWRGTAQYFDNQQRTQALQQEGFENASNARAMSTVKYRNAYNATQNYGADKQIQENLLKGGYDNMRRTDADTLMREIHRKQTEVYAKKEGEALERMHANITAEGGSNARLQSTLRDVHADIRNATLAQANQITLDSEEIAFDGMAKRLAEAEHKSKITERLSNDQALRQQIGEIRGVEGEHLVHAMAIAEERKQFGEFVNARKEIMKHFKIGSADTAKLSMGENVDKVRNGVTLTFDANDQYTREAAIDNIFQVGSYNDIMRVIESTGVGGVNYEYRSTAQDSLLRNGKTKIAPFLNDKALDAILNGQYTGAEFTMKQVIRRIAEGRLTGDDLSVANANALKLMFTSGGAINNPAHPEHGNWQRALTAMLNDARDPAERAQLEMDYHTYFGQMRRTVIETLKDPDFRRGTASQSVTAMRQFVGIADSEDIDRINWDTDPRF